MPGSFAWSASRHDTFATCRRRYYYSYYAAADDPEIRRLKKLSALPMWAGSVVHDAIESFLRSTGGKPSADEEEAVVRQAVHSRMVSDWRESEAGGPAPDGAGAPPVAVSPEALAIRTATGASSMPAEPHEPPPLPFRLFEHEYGVAVEQEDKRIAVNTVMRSLKNFFKSPTLERVFAVGRGQWLALEDLVSFQVDDVEVRVRMDLAYRDHDGSVVIVDWKTGRGEGRFNEVQVAGYALYASEQGWVDAPERIATELSYLVIPKTVRRAVDQRKVDHLRNFIRKSASSMRELLVDARENVARIEDFPMIERPSVCRRCNFRRLCFPRTEAAADPARAAEPEAAEAIGAPGAVTASA
jgi:CRISPR/Cas system-associated exonuclease Cas4 (RecB family)